ncbi:YkvA family protein [Luteipulveratus mongoliensis]|uniref:YkvA family protein n=1 Tax=Luteipulveratus mongoliensis TaxID=571913 RepID=UPI0009F8742A|nr:YkvA family protein [Luteipulveratus mongoliensis]
MHWLLTAAIWTGASLFVLWLALVVALLLLRPRDGKLREALRLLPDLLRLLKRLATDSTMPRSSRVRLALLLAYLALPIDLVPDFVPVLGYADDAILVAAVLRSIAQASGIETLRRRWPGTPDGFVALCRLVGIPVSVGTSAAGRAWNFVSGSSQSLAKFVGRSLSRR